MIQTILHSALTVFGIGFIIFVHELGHYLAARYVGVRVEAFSIGFGPRLFGWRRGPTDYKVCAIPLGGYVKMAGEDPTRPTTGEPDQFGSKTVGQRVLVISAGVIMNVLFALVAIPVAFSVGITFERPDIGVVETGSPAWEAGLKPGDEVYRVNGRRVLSFSDVVQDIALGREVVDLTIRRGGEEFQIPVRPSDIRDVGIPLIGIQPNYELPKLAADPDPEAAGADEKAVQQTLRDAGITREHEMVAFNGIPASNAAAFSAELSAALMAREAVVLTFEKDGVRKDVELPSRHRASEDNRFEAGIVFGGPVVGSVRPERSDLAAFHPGDIIRSISAPGAFPVRINGRDIPIALGSGVHIEREDAPLEYDPPEVGFHVSRGDGNHVIVLHLPTRESRRRLLSDIALKTAGFHIWVVPGSPAEEAGLQTGDRLVKAGGAELASIRQVQDIVQDSKGSPVSLRVERFGEFLDIEVVPRRETVYATMPALERRMPLYEVREPLGEAFFVGFVQTGRMFRRVIGTLRSLFAGSVSPKHLGGIITIFDASKKHAEFFGIMRWLFFLAMISINLAVLNILPIPVLDGGWLVFLLIEKITGKPPSESVVGTAQWAGLALVLGLMVFVTWNDIARLIGIQ